jgi:peptidyl-dipeptidase A
MTPSHRKNNEFTLPFRFLATRKYVNLILIVVFALANACAPKAVQKKNQAAEPATAEGAKLFITRVNHDLKKLWADSSKAAWINNTHITQDTDYIAAQYHEKVLKYSANAIKESAKFNGLKLDEKTARMMTLLRVSSPLVAPDNASQRTELAQLQTKMESMYGKGKFCPERLKDSKEPCLTLQQLSQTMAKSRNYDELLEAWTGWRTISPAIRPSYQRFIELANFGAKEIGFEDTSVLWRSGYDMSATKFTETVENLWQQVSPFYEQLHCYVRAKLQKKYPQLKDKKLIPAHVLGNMWAQSWGNIYELVEPYPGQANLDVTAALEKKKWDALKMVKLGEKFFTSMGLNPLPETFYERSMITRPKDREVVCHASAWDVDYNNDVRIKMCTEVNEEDLVTIHHELGHIYYYQYYYNEPVLFQDGAHDGFHEAIGDTIALSITPDYLNKVGILNKTKENKKLSLNVQMKHALDKVAFLPFGLLIDQWRWRVYNGEISPEQFNTAWWELRKKYQGIEPPVQRDESNFDPGAKYHIPSNVPYTRYFLADILQFQFHRSLCKTAGHEGELHTCSIYGNKDAGEKLKAVLKAGSQKPWQDTLESMTGQREMDASAILDYYAPLHEWLKKQNENSTCGW